jgi:hypothetical protein
VRALAAACALTALAACDPIWQVRGVVFIPKPLRPEGERTGIVDAYVKLRCPIAEPTGYAEGHGHTAPDGKYHLQGTGLIDMSCKVEVIAEGFLARSFPVSEVCTRRFDESLCMQIDLDVELRRPH